MLKIYKDTASAIYDAAVQFGGERTSKESEISERREVGGLELHFDWLRDGAGKPGVHSLSVYATSLDNGARIRSPA